MTEKLRALKFDHFRGLPDSYFDLKNKSLVLLGLNGKGKSALVDGLEFVFSGKVCRFLGEGTGSINHDDAIRHVKRLGTPEVKLHLTPSNSTVSRALGSNIQFDKEGDCVSYIESHPDVDAFILRRDKILDFVRDKDADRYQKFVKLLGLSELDNLQRAFISSENLSKIAYEGMVRALSSMLAPFIDVKTGFEPRSLQVVINKVIELIKSFDIDEFSDLEDAKNKLELIKNKRPEKNKVYIEYVTKALINFEASLVVEFDGLLKILISEKKRIDDLGSSSVDAPKIDVITHGLDYLKRYTDDSECPLCEEKISVTPSDLVARLEERKDSLSELNNSARSYNEAFRNISRLTEKISDQLKKDISFEKLIDDDLYKELRHTRAVALRLVRLLFRRKGNEYIEIDVNQSLLDIDDVRRRCFEAIDKEKDKVQSPDTAELEYAIIMFERLVISHDSIKETMDALDVKREIYSNTQKANNAFTSAREKSIEITFDKISETVFKFYKELHELGVGNDSTECSSVKLETTDRARAGGLRLCVDFLGLSSSKDPRAFLSEGHLDSLGLCLFLAAVRIFNPPGSLLVLDDVLTSIDKEHRHRVGELLFNEFSDYQIIMTTHDEYWYNQLKSSAAARAVQGNWTFQKIESWDVDAGPQKSVNDFTWSFIEEHLTESEYRELGGAFRLILEDFLKRVSDKMGVKVRFRCDGKYTSADFIFSGIGNKIREELVHLYPKNEKDILNEVASVFGQDEFINFLSHDNPGRLEIALGQANDFFYGLRSLVERCKEQRLIKAS